MWIGALKKKIVKTGFPELDILKKGKISNKNVREEHLQCFLLLFSFGIAGRLGLSISPSKRCVVGIGGLEMPSCSLECVSFFLTNSSHYQYGWKTSIDLAAK